VKTLETWIPKRGLSIPCITVLDGDGRVLEADQRRLVRYLVQSGRGADVLFAMGTTGEWKQLDAERRERVMRIVVDEVRKCDAKLARRGRGAIEAWVGVTAPSARETLEALDFALEIEADAAVIAPLAISDVADPVRFLMRDVADLLDARERRIPVFLYDNADIAAGRQQYLRTRWVKQMSRLDFVRGIKVSAPPRKLGHYTKAARQFHDLGAFGIYVGNALYVLDMMRPRTGLWGSLVEHWNRFLLHDLLPAGVVAGPANLWPREWQYAWQVSSAGDGERMAEVGRLLKHFGTIYRFPEGKRTLAALKRGLLRLGVISSDRVAEGTPALDARQADRFDADFEALRSDVRASLPERWCSDAAEAEEA